MPVKSTPIDVTTLRNIRSLLEGMAKEPVSVLSQMEKRLSLGAEKVRNSVTAFYPKIILPKDLYNRCVGMSSLELVVNEVNAALWPVIGFLDTLVNPLDGVFNLVESEYYEAKNLVKTLELALLDCEIFYQIHITKTDRDHHVTVVLGQAQEVYRKIETHYSQTKAYVKWLESLVEQYTSMLSTLRLKSRIQDRELWVNNMNSGLPKFGPQSQPGPGGLVWGAPQGSDEDSMEQMKEAMFDVDSLLHGDPSS